MPLTKKMIAEHEARKQAAQQKYAKVRFERMDKTKPDVWEHTEAEIKQRNAAMASAMGTLNNFFFGQRGR